MERTAAHLIGSARKARTEAISPLGYAARRMFQAAPPILMLTIP
jgi:hypothetical protein